MKNFKKYYKIMANPADIYNALTNKVMIEIWTGEMLKWKKLRELNFRCGMKAFVA